VEKRVQHILNTLYGVMSNETKEQEKRRRITKVYMEETEELEKLVALAVSAKHIAGIKGIEAKVQHLSKYNAEQEELADKLVYRCNNMKMHAPSSYDIERAVNVLLKRKTNMPQSVCELAEALAMKKKKESACTRIEQLGKIYVQKSGVWQDKDVKIKYEKEKVIVESHGFVSTLMLCGRVTEPNWHVVSIEPVWYEGKTVPTKLIKGRNAIQEVVHITRYIRMVLEIEEAYKMLRECVENKVYEITVAGTTKEYTATVLGMYKIDAHIAKGWNGPAVHCMLQYGSTRMLYKENVMKNISTEIEKQIRKECTESVSFTVQRGIVYKGKRMYSMRELRKERAQEENAKHRTDIEGVVVHSRMNILVENAVVQTALYIRDIYDEYIAVAWSKGSAEMRMYYGMHRVSSIPAGREVHIDRRVQKEGAHSREAYKKAVITTSICDEKVAEIVKSKPRHIIDALSVWKALNKIEEGCARIALSTEYIEITIQDIVTVRITKKEEDRSTVHIESAHIQIVDKMNKDETTRIAWIAAQLRTINTKKIARRCMHSAIQGMHVQGCIRYNIDERSIQEDSTHSKTVTMYTEHVQLALAYKNKKIECKTGMPYMRMCVESALAAQSIAGLAQVCTDSTVLSYNGLVSTVPVHGMLGGACTRTLQSIILYRVTADTIHIQWRESTQSERSAVADAFAHIEHISAEKNKIVVHKREMMKVLETMSMLLERERRAEYASKYGSTFAITRHIDRQQYIVKVHADTGFVCTQEGAPEEVIDIVRKGPDPERMLMEAGYVIEKMKSNEK